MKFNLEQRKKMAAEMREMAKNYLADGIQTWKDDYDSEDMIAMIRRDAKTYREIATLIRHNRIDEAGEMASLMDTAARDEIPSSIYHPIVFGEEA